MVNELFVSFSVGLITYRDKHAFDPVEFCHVPMFVTLAPRRRFYAVTFIVVKRLRERNAVTSPYSHFPYCLYTFLPQMLFYNDKHSYVNVSVAQSKRDQRRRTSDKKGAGLDSPLIDGRTRLSDLT